MSNSKQLPKAFGRRVLVHEIKPAADDAKTAGGLHLPESARKERFANRGTVKNAGHKDLEHLVGRTITWADFGSTNLHDFPDHTVIPEDAIVAVFPGGE